MAKTTREIEGNGKVFTIHGAPNKCVVFMDNKHSGTYWDNHQFKSLTDARRAVRFYIARHSAASEAALAVG
jgi:hypothetical protein